MTGPIPPAGAALTKHAITVLLVDDQPMVGDAVRRMLAPEKDIVFHFCPDPARALAMAAEVRPTVILQDLVMPEIDGLTLVRFFRSHPELKDVPMIVLSSNEEAVTKADAFETGANDYLVKLPDRIELVARIRYHSAGYINLLQRNEAYDALLKSQQALAAELSSAAEYVMSLLPPALSEGPIRTEWRFVPSEQLGGDSFGYHWIDGDHFAMYLLDVCDHGVGPALLSVTALNVLRTMTLPGVDFREPDQVLRAMNDMFQMDKHNNLYFTLWYGVYRRKERKIAYSTAGHPPALLFNGSGPPRDLATPNLMIGGMPGVPYKSGCSEVTIPARLYIFSDGVYEIRMRDGTMWNLAGFRDFLVMPPASSGSEIEALFQFVRGAGGGGPLDDDFSLLKVSFES
ncbi:MAG: SpoIIE family protein phosphatase [Lentisphaerae bacterium]|nr:SpoIIE family protein phosphatase [Lentisphaerota bacterium]